MWMWSLPRQKCRWSSLICSAPMNWSHALLLSVMQIFGGSIFSRPSVFLGWWIMRWGLWLHSAPLIVVSSCSPGWSWPNQSVQGPAHLNDVLVLSVSSVAPDISSLSAQKQHQVSHWLISYCKLCFFIVINVFPGCGPPQLWLFFLWHSRFKRLATPELNELSETLHLYAILSRHVRLGLERQNFFGWWIKRSCQRREIMVKTKHTFHKLYVPVFADKIFERCYNSLCCAVWLRMVQRSQNVANTMPLQKLSKTSPVKQLSLSVTIRV